LETDDHRFLVEPASGAALAFIYSNVFANLKKRTPCPAGPASPVVIIVCGGNSVTLELIDEWKRKFSTSSSASSTPTPHPATRQSSKKP
jgi:L-serine/L-threonine ammonia-lyase